MSTKKLSKSKSKTRTTSKRKYILKSAGANDLSITLLKTLTNDLTKNASSYNENLVKINYLSKLIKSEKAAVNYYQDNSTLINGFLRKGYSFLSEFNKTTIINDLGKSNFKTAIKELINKINAIDHAFSKTNCPKTTQNTILYRGSNALYAGINKGFISSSKSIEAIFDMNFVKGDKILSDSCCLNVLVVDKNIPYLDLENNNEKWSYQKEVLLPRGLIVEVVEESTFQYNKTDFKVYVMHVMINNDENVYTLPELPQDDSVDMAKINFIIHNQRMEIVNLSNMFMDTNEWPDEKEDINDLIEYIYDLEKKGIFTEEQYNSICNKILNTLKKSVPEMMKSSLVRDECKPVLQEVLDKVDEMLSTENALITFNKDNYIKVKEC